MKQIYLDNAATTKVDPEVFKVMKPYFGRIYGNASEYHNLGVKARKAIEEAREKVASFLGAKPQEIIFTSSATESINLSHKGLIEALRLATLAQGKPSSKILARGKPHIITSQIEHKAVLEVCKHLERTGWASVTYLPVDHHGRVSVEALEKTIRQETVLVSIMYVNNEVGVVEPIEKIGNLLKEINKKRKTKIYFHTDATQAINFLNCNVDFLGVDFLSLTGHKIYTPKGIGALFVREGTPIIRQMDGGGQERGTRSGTENVPYIVGLGKAIEITQNSNVKTQNLKKLRDKLIEGMLKIPGVGLTGHPKDRVPHIASFIVDGVEGEALVLALSDLGIYISSGSACTAKDLTPSHVLTAMGVPPEKSHGSIRFSLGKDTTEQDIDYVIANFPKVVKRLRKMAPQI